MTCFKPLTEIQRVAIHRQAVRIWNTPPTGQVHNLPCPKCGQPLQLVKSMFGRIYRCRRRGCPGTHGARADGTPTWTEPKPMLLRKIEAMERAMDEALNIALARDRTSE